jgi:RimJ/RimL family protein N-acetyltransferase
MAAPTLGSIARRAAVRTLVAGDLVLEPQCAAHAEAMFDVLRDPAIYIYENEPPASLDALRARFLRLETRRSGDGAEHWLNWVVRLAGGPLMGYVQATVRRDASALIAYVFASAHWGRGYASRAVAAMIDELARNYGVQRLDAIAVRRNERSLRVLQRLGFAPASAAEHARRSVEPAEVLWLRTS